MPDDFDDRKVKELIDAATQSELAKWFALPSFEQAREDNPGSVPPEEEDPEIIAVRERREKACAAVDPALLERIRIRTEVTPETLMKLDFHVEIHVR
ncbi:MAG TPA: hypothetical protein VGC41_08955 [Kofleriaceae bacterium]